MRAGERAPFRADRPQWPACPDTARRSAANPTQQIAADDERRERLRTRVRREQAVQVSKELVATPLQVRRRQHTRRRSAKAGPACEQQERDDRHGREPRHETPDADELGAEGARFAFDAARHTARHLADRDVDRRRKAKRLVPAFARAELLDEARGVLRHQDLHPLHGRTDPMAGKRPQRKRHRRDEPVNHQDRKAARERPPSAPGAAALCRSRSTAGAIRVREDERQEDDEQHAGGGELIEDDGEDHEADQRGGRRDVERRAPALVAARRLSRRQVGEWVGRQPAHARLSHLSPCTSTCLVARRNRDGPATRYGSSGGNWKSDA